MELNELLNLRTEIEALLAKELSSYSRRVSVNYVDSPNPVCFFEVEGACFAQGSFWANNEYRIEAMKVFEPIEIINEAGLVTSIQEALSLVETFCRNALAAAH